MKSQRWIVAVVVVQSILLLAAWSGKSVPATAEAQVPNPAEQRNRQLDELQKLNGQVDKLVKLLESGKLQVVAKSPDTK
jgi:soluble cytochrome b562